MHDTHKDPLPLSPHLPLPLSPGTLLFAPEASSNRLLSGISLPAPVPSALFPTRSFFQNKKKNFPKEVNSCQSPAVSPLGLPCCLQGWSPRVCSLLQLSVSLQGRDRGRENVPALHALTRAPALPLWEPKGKWSEPSGVGLGTEVMNARSPPSSAESSCAQFWSPGVRWV